MPPPVLAVAAGCVMNTGAALLPVLVDEVTPFLEGEALTRPASGAGLHVPQLPPSERVLSQP